MTAQLHIKRSTDALYIHTEVELQEHVGKREKGENYGCQKDKYLHLSMLRKGCQSAIYWPFYILPHVQSFESVEKCFVKAFKFYKHSNSTNMIISV